MVGYLGGHLYSVEDVTRMSREVATKVNDTFRPDLVVGILNDGALPALEMADALGMPVDFIEIKRSFGYSPPILVGRMSSKVRGNRSVLLVDDVFDSGRTANVGRSYIEEQGCGRVMTAVLNFMETGEKTFHRKAPDFWAIRDDYSCFPWRTISPHRADYDAYLLRKGFVQGVRQ
ncbi:MAG: hypothetical protein HY516_05300 [Candidatus Aenigmarchaeota archaeon]|nr:hypothetical protein [Candidatus Aenigmarchaeota archaeon]